jgi:lipopolysaccharide export system permease protein
MAVLVAVLYGYSQLGSDNEITAMRANGVSVVQMLRPALVGGAILALLNFLFVDQVLPRTNARLRNLQTDISHKKPAFQMREQAINDLQPYSIRASRVFPGSGRLRDVEVFDHSLADGRRVIYADSGLMAFDRNQTDLIFRLYAGRVHEFKTAEPGRIQITKFTQNTIRIKDVQNLLERNIANFERGDREMTTCEMMDEVSAARRAAATATLTRNDLVRQDLRSLMRLSQTGLSPRIADSTPVRHCGKWREVERLRRRSSPQPRRSRRRSSRWPPRPTRCGPTPRLSRPRRGWRHSPK